MKLASIAVSLVLLGVGVAVILLYDGGAAETMGIVCVALSCTFFGLNLHGMNGK